MLRIFAVAAGAAFSLGVVPMHAHDVIRQPEQVAAGAKPSGDMDDSILPAACTKCVRETTGRCCCLVCCPETKRKKVEKQCFKVRREHVCIPAFQWPWKCRCQANCGTVRSVNVLDEESYECEECVTEWKVRCVQRRCNDGGQFDGGARTRQREGDAPRMATAPADKAQPAGAFSWLTGLWNTH